MNTCCIAVLTGLVLFAHGRITLAAADGDDAAVAAAAADDAAVYPLGTELTSGTGPVMASQAAVLSREESRHLLARSGIGVAAAQLLALRDMTRQEAVDTIVSGLQTAPEQKMPDWVDLPLPHYYRRDAMDEDERQRFTTTRDAELAHLRQWWIAEMLATSSPQTERLVFFWHDLFATSYHAIGNRSRAMALQNRRFRELGTGSWEALLKAMIRDPALLDFLDNNSNRAKSPNENFARELLELFTLGEGNFDEATVRAAARALTGMSSSDTFDDAYLLRTWHHDRGEKTLFGETARFDGDGLIDAILDQPPAARFLVRRFWLAFISDAEPPADWVESMATRFRHSDFDLLALYSAVLSSEAFWAPEHRGSLIKSPLDIVVGTARALEYPKTQWQSMAATMGNLEMDLFAPPDVAGWPEGAALVTPGRLLDRQYALDDLVALNPAVSDEGTMMMAASFQTLKIRIAAENYRGPARIRVKFGDGDDLIWVSEEKTVRHGIDTRRFGLAQGIGTLPWHEMTFEVPEDKVEKATSVSIVFANDAGAEDGDRNVYVDGITFNEKWVPAASGNQSGDCPPEGASAAGHLYCNGELTLGLPELAVEMAELDLPAYRSSAAQLRWASASDSKNRQSAMFILDHVRTPSKTFDLVSFDLIAHDDDSINLKISSFACLPACFDQFGQCAREDALFPKLKSMSFPLAVRTFSNRHEAGYEATEQDPDSWCGYDSLSASEKALVATLWRSVPSLIELTRNSRRGLQFAEPLAQLESRLKEHPVSVAQSFWAQVPGEGMAEPVILDVDPDFKPPDATPSRLDPPETLVNSLDELVAELADENISLEDVLLSGVGSERFGSLSGLSKLPPGQQLRRLLDHPVFQVR